MYDLCRTTVSASFQSFCQDFLIYQNLIVKLCQFNLGDQIQTLFLGIIQIVTYGIMELYFNNIFPIDNTFPNFTINFRLI